MHVYVPSNDCDCVSVSNGDILRCYTDTPRQNTTVNYIDYYINSHYLEKGGTQTFNQYTSLPVCVPSNQVTNNVMYRSDLDGILICFLIILLICFYFPYRIISRAFGRWLKW